MNQKLGLIILLVIFAMSCKEEANHKFGYVNSGELINRFDLKKELDITLSSALSNQKVLTDSLSKLLNVKYDQITLLEGKEKEDEIIVFRNIEAILKKRKEEFQVENEEKVVELNRQMYGQLNQYIKEYGEEHKYTYIFGTTSEGNIMFAKESEEITEEVQEYINKKYQGSPKK